MGRVWLIAILTAATLVSALPHKDPVKPEALAQYEQHAFPCRDQCGDHGRCNETLSVCVCDIGWIGKYCETHAYDIGPFYICAGCEHGKCLNGTCVCDDGWAGKACNNSLCPKACSGHGHCSKDAGCVCDKGFYGGDCSQILVPKAGGVQVMNFKAYLYCLQSCVHGDCLDNKCICHDGYIGDGCEDARCTLDCSGRGNCVKGHCFCDDGWKGPGCIEADPVKPCPHFCSYHGVCSFGKCECFVNWAGANCSQAVCEENCNNVGSCVDGQCYCDEGFEGRACEVQLLTTGHGRYIRGQLFCDAGFSLATNCTQPLCPGESNTDISLSKSPPCGGHGRCFAGACSCDSGYQGEDCSVEVVTVQGMRRGLKFLKEDRTICLKQFTGKMCELHVCTPACEHGLCNEFGFCECAVGWTGELCADPWVCHGMKKSNSSGYFCECNPGWHGFQCQYRDCENDCNGHGICDNGTCICELGWSDSSYCSERKCDSCEHGECQNGLCVCDEGWYGPECMCSSQCDPRTGNCESGLCVCADQFTGEDCSLRSCPNGCFETEGQGQCNYTTGGCICTFGWEGEDCGREANLCPNQCSCRGTCLGSGCLCDEGYEGDDCSTMRLPSDHGTLRVVTSQNLTECTVIDLVTECDEGWTSTDSEICFRENGASYRGRVAKTMSGYTCQSWSTQYPASHPFDPRYHPTGGLDGNQCRNPDGILAPWCYAIEIGKKEYCDIHPCWSDELKSNMDLFSTLCNVRGCDNMIQKNCGKELKGRCQNGSCVCNPNFKGADCLKPACLNNCFGNGYCDPSVGECLCNPQYDGEYCELFRLPFPQHGVRDADFQVKCDPGYLYPDCVDLICPLNCSSEVNNTRHGRCDAYLRKCECDRPWRGVGCETYSAEDDWENYCGTDANWSPPTANSSKPLCECKFGAVLNGDGKCYVPKGTFEGMRSNGNSSCPFCDASFCNFVFPFCTDDALDMAECQRLIQDYCTIYPEDPGCCCDYSQGTAFCPFWASLRCLSGPGALTCTSDQSRCDKVPSRPECSEKLMAKFAEKNADEDVLGGQANNTTGVSGGGAIDIQDITGDVGEVDFGAEPTPTPEFPRPENCYLHGRLSVGSVCECDEDWFGEYCSISREDCIRARVFPANYKPPEKSSPVSPEEAEEPGEGDFADEYGEEEQEAIPFTCQDSCHHHGLCQPSPIPGVGWCRCYPRFSKANNCANLVCPKDCSGHGWCKGRCICHEGWGGVDCSSQYPTNSRWMPVEVKGDKPNKRSWIGMAASKDDNRLFFQLLSDLVLYMPFDGNIMSATGQDRDGQAVGVWWDEIFDLDHFVTGSGSAVFRGSGYVKSEENALLQRESWTFTAWFKAGEPPDRQPEVSPPTGCADLTLLSGKRWHDSDSERHTCGWYSLHDRCTTLGTGSANDGYSASLACCVCGGGKGLLGCESKTWIPQTYLGSPAILIKTCNEEEMLIIKADELYGTVVQTFGAKFGDEYTIKMSVQTDSVECDTEYDWWCGGMFVVCEGKNNPDFHKDPMLGGSDCYGNAKATSEGSWHDLELSFSSTSDKFSIYLLTPPVVNVTSSFKAFSIIGEAAPSPSPTPSLPEATEEACDHMVHTIFSTAPSSFLKAYVKREMLNIAVAGTCKGSCYEHPTPIADGEWHFIGVVFSQGALLIQVDDEVVFELADASAPIGSTGGGVTIGANGYGKQRFCGWIDDFAVWERPLGPGELGMLALQNPVLKDPNTAVELPKPNLFWDFKKTDSTVGDLYAEVLGDASIGQTGLTLTAGVGNYLATLALSERFTSKTMEVWVKLSTLRQSGGAAMVMGKLDNTAYDAIAFGVIKKKYWMPESENSHRSENIGGVAETDESTAEYVHLAVTYEETSSGDARVTMYRNGIPVAPPFIKGQIIGFEPEGSYLAFGVLHLTDTGTPVNQLEGQIKCAAVYDRALTAPELELSFKVGCELSKPGDSFVMYGGYEAKGGKKSDVLRYDTTKGVFKRLSVKGVEPVPRYGHAMTYSIFSESLWLFGGAGETFGDEGTGGNTRYLNDLWVYRLGEWESLVKTDPWPEARLYPSLTSSADGQTLYLFGGSYYMIGHIVMNDMWIYHARDNTWERYEACHVELVPDSDRDPLVELARTDKQFYMPDAGARKVHGLWIDPQMRFDSDGVVTAWQFPVKSPGVHFLQVWRGSGSTYTLVGENKVESNLPQVQTVMVSIKDRIHVKEGDVVGWRHDGDGVLSYEIDNCHEVRYYFFKPETPPPPPPIPDTCSQIVHEVTCESKGGRRRTCSSSDTICDVRVKEQISTGSKECKEGMFGFFPDTRYFWAKNGCRAVFAVRHMRPSCSSKGCCPSPSLVALGRGLGEVQLAPAVSGIPGAVSLHKNGKFVIADGENAKLEAFVPDNDEFLVSASYFLLPGLNGKDELVSFRASGTGTTFLSSFRGHHLEDIGALPSGRDKNKSSFKVIARASPHGSGCPGLFWVPVGSGNDKRCLRVIPCGDSCTWESALTACEDVGGVLASLPTEEHVQAAAGMMTTSFGHCGAYCSNDTLPCPAGEWKWIDDANSTTLNAVVETGSGKYASLGADFSMKGNDDMHEEAVCQVEPVTSECAGVKMISASYGENCVAENTNNKLALLAAFCNGKFSCVFTLSGSDPAPGCHKEFTAKWMCGTEEKSMIVGQGCENSGGGEGNECQEAYGKEIKIECSPGEGTLAHRSSMLLAQVSADSGSTSLVLSSTSQLAEQDEEVEEIPLLEPFNTEVVSLLEKGGCNSPCYAPSLRYKGGNMTIDPQLKGIELKNAIDESPTEGEFCINTAAPLWSATSHQALCGEYVKEGAQWAFKKASVAARIGKRYEITFYEPCGTGSWTFRGGLHVTFAAVVFLDNDVIWEEEADVSKVIEIKTERLSKGNHKIQIYGWALDDKELGGWTFARAPEPAGTFPLYSSYWFTDVCKADCTDYGTGFGEETEELPKPDAPAPGQSVYFEKTTGHVYSVKVIWDKAHGKYGRSQSCPPSRHGHAASTYLGNLYIFGGIRNGPSSALTEFLNDLWMFEASSKTWFHYGDVIETRLQAPAPRAGACVAVETSMGDVIVSMGFGPQPEPVPPSPSSSPEPKEEAQGLTDEQKAEQEQADSADAEAEQGDEDEKATAQLKEMKNLGFNDLWRYNFERDHWTQIQATPDADEGSPDSREYPGCALVDKRFYIFGGTVPNRDTEVLGDMWYYDFEFDKDKEVEKKEGGPESCYTLMLENPERGSGKYKIKPPKLEEEEKKDEEKPEVESTEPEPYDFGKVVGKGWHFVRRVKAGTAWHPSTDHLAGTDEYGEFDKNITADATFSRKFSEMIFDQFLFATGDMEKWVIMGKDILKTFGKEHSFQVIKSSAKMETHPVMMYNRQTNDEDPWIGVINHEEAVTRGELVYGANSFSGEHSKILQLHKGANVFIRSAPIPEVPAANVEEFDVYCDMTTQGGGWTLVAYAEDCLLGGADLESFNGQYEPELRRSSANVNALRVGKVSTEVMYTWDRATYPIGPIHSYRMAIKHNIPGEGLVGMRPDTNDPDSKAYVKVPVTVIRNKDGISLPKEMYTKQGSLMTSFNKAFGVVREPRDFASLEWEMDDRPYSAFYLGLSPLEGNAGIATVSGEGIAHHGQPKTCAMWMR